MNPFGSLSLPLTRGTKYSNLPTPSGWNASIRWDLIGFWCREESESLLPGRHQQEVQSINRSRGWRMVLTTQYHTQQKNITKTRWWCSTCSTHKAHRISRRLLIHFNHILSVEKNILMIPYLHVYHVSNNPRDPEKIDPSAARILFRLD